MASEQSDGVKFILLLPPATSSPTLANLKAAYGDTLRQVLKEAMAQSQDTVQASLLEIALACPHLADLPNSTRSQLFAKTQIMVAGLYKLICVLAAQDHVNVEDDDGVDVRILLVAWSPETKSPQASSYGPVVDLQTLAASRRPWEFALGVESEEGQAFMQAFGQAMKSAQAGSMSSQAPSQQSAAKGAVRHDNVAVGGTFDHVHIGHKLLLTMTVFAVDKPDSSSGANQSIVIGITGDELLKNKKHAEFLQSWNDRQQSVYRFIKALIDFAPPGSPEPQFSEVNEPGPNGHAVVVTFASGLQIKFVEIWDPFGPTITEKDISALIISGETRSGGKAVNDKRAEKGWPGLKVLEVDVLDSEDHVESAGLQAANANDFQSKLSSTEIRRKLSAKATSSSL
ncbi:hypothetical protein MBLNU457_4665t1 [Dothideomycetes sp. NU457]